MVLHLKQGAAKKEMDDIFEKLWGKSKATRGVDTKKFCGVIKLKEDLLAIQQKMRNEWKKS